VGELVVTGPADFCGGQVVPGRRPSEDEPVVTDPGADGVPMYRLCATTRAKSNRTGPAT